MTVAVANSFRTEKSALKISSFPYCSDLKPKLRQATPAEIRAFVAGWEGTTKER